MRKDIGNFFASLLKLLFFHFYALGKSLWKSKDGIPLKAFLSDFLAVLRSSAVSVILSLLALAIFTLLPQGHDVLLVVVEDLRSGQVGSLIWLLMGLGLWSVVAEYTGRYSMYVSDNSGKSLSDERVVLRKNFQRILSSLFLVMPYLVVLTGFVVDYFMDTSTNTTIKGITFGIPAGLVYLMMNFMSVVYMGVEAEWEYIDPQGAPDQGDNNDGNDNDTTPGTTPQRAKNDIRDDSFKSELQVNSKALLYLIDIAKGVREGANNILGRTDEEKKWCDKLFGIYTDYVFTIRKLQNFKGDARDRVQDFENEFIGPVNDTQYTRNPDKEYIEPLEDVFRYGLNGADVEYFPKNNEYIASETIVPDTFILRSFSNERDKPNGLLRWTYFIPYGFYKHLHKQVIVISLTCLALFLTICFLGVDQYENLGSPALVVLSFACWTGIYLGLLFLDNAIFRQGLRKNIGSKVLGGISIRFLLLVSLFFVSYINGDHPARISAAGKVDDRKELTTHFAQWINEYARDTTHYYHDAADTAIILPVTFVCAEGGASRTGAFSALTLSMFQDRRNDIPHHVDFKRSVYAYSGVSGGCLGLSFFNSMAYLNSPDDLRYADSLKKDAVAFFDRDFLAPVLGKMLFGDILALWLPGHVESLDRAIALEKSWESAYEKVVKSGRKNYLSSDFISAYRNRPAYTYPAFFINTTEVESGRQCWMANVKPASSMMLYDQRDLLLSKVEAGIRLSTVTGFSTRFPLISPAATLQFNDVSKRHYVDGGYVENTGAGTMLEILRALAPVMDNLHIATDTLRFGHKRVYVRPYVVAMRYSDDTLSGSASISFCNEIMEIVDGMVNTRDGRTEAALNDLGAYVKSRGGDMSVLKLSASGNDVPLNWVLSARSLENMNAGVKKMWDSRNTNALKKLYFFNTEELQWGGGGMYPAAPPADAVKPVIAKEKGNRPRRKK